MYLDKVMLRKIKRTQQAARRGIGDTSDIEPEEDDGDASMVAGEARDIKKERVIRNRRWVAEDVEED